MAKGRLIAAMSGGVDSSAAVKILLRQGYDLCGVTFNTGDMSDAEINDAKAVAAHFGLEHRVIDIKELFDEKIKKYFAAEYLRGRTPNPCVICNREIKFGYLLSLAQEMGYDGIATGHYARIVKDSGSIKLYSALDGGKDQSYMLSLVPSDALSCAVFPLGTMTKKEIREIAAKEGLGISEKKDSQDICFVPNGEYADFIGSFTGTVPGAGRYIDKNGSLLGENRGHIHYTIGQRKGLGIALGSPRYVTDKDPVRNTVTLGDEEDLFFKTVYTENFNVITDGEVLSGEYLVKLRYSHKFAKAEIEKYKDGYRLLFDAPQRAPSPGQFAVLYREDDFGIRVVGGAPVSGRE